MYILKAFLRIPTGKFLLSIFSCRCPPVHITYQIIPLPVRVFFFIGTINFQQYDNLITG